MEERKSDLFETIPKNTPIPLQFEDRSEIAQEIISRKPDFYEKWALMIFILLLLLLVLGTWFVRYPDIIQAGAVLTGDNAPKEIIAKQSGRITALFVKANQKVKKDEVIGWLETNAQIDEVMELSKKLDSCIDISQRNNTRLMATILNKRFANLGELQLQYQSFISAWLQYSDYLINGFFLRRKEMLESDIAALKTIQGNIGLQKSITNADNVLAQKTFEMNKRLFEEKVISAEEYRQAQSKLLNNQKTIPQSEVSIISQQSQIRDKQKEIDQLNHDFNQQKLLFEQELQTLRSVVNEWLKKHTIQSPTDGVVVFTLPLQQSQNIEQGKVLGFVNPVNSRYFAELRLAQTNFGKVDTGMKVLLQFDAYPFQEIGYVNGTLNYLSNVATDSVFWGTVRLDNGLLTNQNKRIQYKTGLKAQARIITKDMRLLERIYYSIIKGSSVK